MRTVNVIFRACDKINAVNRLSRPFGLGKGEVIKTCFTSLMRALAKIDHAVTVLGDDLSEELCSFFSSYGVPFHNMPMGNNESIRRSFGIASECPDGELVYFCEDDYLHDPDTFVHVSDIEDSLDQIVNAGTPVSKLLVRNARFGLNDIFFFLADYPDRYRFDQLDPSIILFSNRRHWRQVNYVTHTLLGSVRSFKKYQSIFYQSAKKPSDAVLCTQLFLNNRCLCLSPLPGLTTHMHEGTMTPGVDWEGLVGALRNRNS